MWAYRYVDGLQSKQAAAPLELGSLIHEYLASFYKNLARYGAKHGSEATHQRALEKTMGTWRPRMTELAEIAFELDGDDAEESAKWLNSLPDQAEELANRYYVVHGAMDAERYEVILIEHPLLTRVAPDIESAGVADMVARERSSGILLLWEHKTTKSPPRLETRLRDVQTALYAQQLEEELDLHIEGMLWNNICTKPPAVPERLKNGSFSRARIDTTWHTYEKTLINAGANPEDYADVRERLEGNESEHWFPRHEYLRLADRGILLRDYVVTAKRMQKVRNSWAKDESQPVRSISYQCDWCSYNKLCTAAIVLGDIRDIVRIHYTTREQRAAADIPEIE